MGKSSNEYQKMADDLISSFRSLKDKNVRVFIIPKWMFWWATAFVFGRFIFINKNFEKMDKVSQVALLAHELCHVEDSIKRGFLQELFMLLYEGLSWGFDTKLSRRVERAVDLRTIKKGYGKELLHLELAREKKFSKKKLEKIHSRGYLSSQEIKSLMGKKK
ncbi:MAG: hypothetical protein KJ600_00500 [Nanoarchaeota archaeon]|nr:hypothetical protein [Nanoarchaeota archaeon]MBU1103023.1 hypothetical protein [Nanoarchaeota archaeon]